MNVEKRLLPWNIVLVLSMVVMLGLLAYDRFVPYPRFQMTGKAIAGQEKRLREQANSLYAEGKEASLMLARRLWSQDAELIGPKAMETATEIASRKQVKISSFRPQKSVHEGTLVRYPFVISLEGTYPQVIGFIRELESPQNKLVVNVVQIASTDGASSAVNAVVNVWALQESKTPDPKAKARKSNV